MVITGFVLLKVSEFLLAFNPIYFVCMLTGWMLALLSGCCMGLSVRIREFERGIEEKRRV
jgi:hypothetical protein